jgi:hypothetical protein
VTRWVCEKIAQNCGPTVILLSTLIHNGNLGKKWHKNVDYFCNFQKTAQSKHSPIGRKFSQSGHTVSLRGNYCFKKWPRGPILVPAETAANDWRKNGLEPGLPDFSRYNIPNG